MSSILNNKTETQNPYLNNPPNFELLIKHYPDFSQYVFKNTYNAYTIDWKNPKAIKKLNQIILQKDFGLSFYDLPEQYLLPTIPSRFNYILWLKELLDIYNKEESNPISVIDIGTGANIIYPILGSKKFGWNFLCSEINESSIQIAKTIINKNNLQHLIKIIHQTNANNIFKGVISQDNNYHFFFSMCNPPFFDYESEIKNDNSHTDNEYDYTEVYYKGGELAFIEQMIKESFSFSNRVFIFTTLVGRKCNYEKLRYYLQSKKNVKIILSKILSQGNNSRYCIAWSFFLNYADFIKEKTIFSYKRSNEYLSFIPFIKKE